MASPPADPHPQALQGQPLFGMRAHPGDPMQSKQPVSTNYVIAHLSLFLTSAVRNRHSSRTGLTCFIVTLCQCSCPFPLHFRAPLHPLSSPARLPSQAPLSSSLPPSLPSLALLPSYPALSWTFNVCVVLRLLSSSMPKHVWVRQVFQLLRAWRGIFSGRTPGRDAAEAMPWPNLKRSVSVYIQGVWMTRLSSRA